MSPTLAAFLSALAIVLVLVGLWLPHGGADTVDGRLAALRGERPTPQEAELRTPFGERVLRPLVRWLADTANRLQRRPVRGATTLGPTAQQRTQLKLMLAGSPYGLTPADFLGTKVLGALALGGAFFLFMTVAGQAVLALLFALFGMAFGWFAPELLLRSRTRRRQKAIQRALPDALDLLVISVEAGLGFDAALQRLVDKKVDALTWEFGRLLAEMRVGRLRRDALKDLVARTEVPDLSRFVNAVLQAEGLGVSIARVLTVQAEQMRTLRRQRAEESAAKLQLKLLMPLALFIFPALCIVILGPIWPAIAGAGAGAPGI